MSGEDRTAMYFETIVDWLNTGRIADVLSKSGQAWEFLKELLMHRVQILQSQRFRLDGDDELKNQAWLFENHIVSVEQPMLKIAGMLRRIVARTDNSGSILIIGANGTGKGLIARAIHREMERKAKRKLPYEPVHCGHLPEDMAVSLLLGHKRGAFTSAVSDQVGHLEKAGDGVLFLDDIHHLSGPAKAALLPAFQERQFRLLGGNKVIEFKARVVSSTNVDLSELHEKGQMPHEFYNRIAGSTIIVPSLAQRPHDVEPLIKHMVGLGSFLPGGDAPSEFEADLVRAFQSYAWPGNVRQLEGVVQQIRTHLSGRVVTLEGVRSLDIRYMNHPIEWDPTPELDHEQDSLLARFGWRGGWGSLSDTGLIAGWLKSILVDAALVDELSRRVSMRSSPKPIHFLKALLFLAVAESNQASHKELENVLGLGWDFTNRIACYLAGIKHEDEPGFQPAFLERKLSAKRKYVYALRADLL